MKPADPQAGLLARLSHGWLSPHDVGPGLSLLLAVTIELVSAFGPLFCQLMRKRLTVAVANNPVKCWDR